MRQQNKQQQKNKNTFKGIRGNVVIWRKTFGFRFRALQD